MRVGAPKLRRVADMMTMCNLLHMCTPYYIAGSLLLAWYIIISWGMHKFVHVLLAVEFGRWTMTSVCASSKIRSGSTRRIIWYGDVYVCNHPSVSPFTNIPRGINLRASSFPLYNPSTSHLLHRLPPRRLAHSLDVAESANQQTRVGNCRHGATTAIKMCTHWGWLCIINTPPNYFCSPPKRTMDVPSRNMSQKNTEVMASYI